MKTTVKKPITFEAALKASNDGKNQSIKQKFVGQHVFCNVSSIAEYILSKSHDTGDGNEAPFSLDDVENYYSYPEWSTKLLGEHLMFNGGSEDDKNTFMEEFQRLKDESVELNDDGKISDETHSRNIKLIEDAEYEFEQIENEPAEIFEWWAVSEFLYRKLKENGRCVVDAGSCYLWGRTTTGQAILLDYVISQICADMGILEGQENSWA